MPKCILLDNHYNLDTEGKVGPCAIYKRDEDNQMRFKSYLHYKASPQYAQLKQNMQNGWDKGCEKCRLDEAHTGKSFRTLFNQDFAGEPGVVEFADISLSNHCNYSCRMCNPKTSSKWQNLIAQNPDIKKFFPKAKNKFISISPQQAFKDIDVKNLKRVKYLGGEPFVTQELYQLIEYLVSNTSCENIDFILTTNCSFFPKKAIRMLEENFKNVVINISIDGYERSCEYSRIGSNWKTIDKIYKQYLRWASNCSNIWIKVHSTVNAYTVQDCEKLTDYVQSSVICANPEGDIEFYNLHQPQHLSVDVLPIEYKQQISNSINQKWLSGQNQSNWLHFVEYTKAIDRASGLHIEDYIPDLAKYLQ